ncbi:hypothetical protein BDB00DRAFT_819560 [Zychaea mexicana]|uniref:uncharacterized protein n=1 Tax=Zychaea mexicana TaxID=64656 RepID=UPI0022FDBE47|nr:uncharacterized protein BDB00DRAFT_819560 [Zychaea mexicana]KAI9494292.1 hypothetical protein BDB00DRAFT_819560 [Zychaea mexicana]
MNSQQFSLLLLLLMRWPLLPSFHSILAISLSSALHIVVIHPFKRHIFSIKRSKQLQKFSVRCHLRIVHDR